MTLVELTWATDRLALYNQLEHENCDESLPVRHMLWYLTSGKIQEGGVYVDQWPSFSHVCCFHPTKLYNSKSDRDFAVLCSADKDAFPQFLSALANERRWRDRDGVILAYVEEHLTEIAKQFLCPDSRHGSCWLSQPLRHYTAYERKNFEEYERLFRQFKLKMPPDLTITKLKPEEAALVSEHWPYDIPEKTEMFKWLIATFPSVCTRDTRGRPIAWAISYSFGPSGGAFVTPECRGKGIAEAQVTDLLTELLQINPGQRFLWIVDDNIASIRQAQRTVIDMRRTDLMVKLMAYTTPYEKNTKSHL